MSWLALSPFDAPTCSVSIPRGNNVVALGSAAVLIVCTTGFAKTKPAGDRHLQTGHHDRGTETAHRDAVTEASVAELALLAAGATRMNPVLS